MLSYLSAQSRSSAVAEEEEEEEFIHKQKFSTVSATVNSYSKFNMKLTF